MYNSLKYWNNRKNPNAKHGLLDYEKTAISEHIKDEYAVLDFGCGVGRTFKLYVDRLVVGLDFSSMYEDQAKSEAKRVNIRYQHLIHNVHKEDLPFTEPFDCGIINKVLLHANDKEAVRILQEVGRVCGKVLLIAFNEPKTKTANHVFSRDYKKLVESLGFKITSYAHTQSQDIIIYEA